VPDPSSISPQSDDQKQHRKFKSASLRLYSLGVKIWVVGGVALAWMSTLDDPIQIVLGLIIYSLAIWPVLKWAQHSKKWFPVFELFMFTGFVFYAIPFLMADESLLNYPASTLMTSGLAVALFQGAACFAFGSTRGRSATASDWIRPLLRDDSKKWALAGIWLNTAYLFAAQFTPLIPYEILSILRAIFYGVGTISVFIIARAWGQGNIKKTEQTSTVFNLLLQCIILASQLYLINVLSLLGLGFIGYVTTSRKIPIATSVLVFSVVAVLHNGKDEMRQIYWQSGERIEVKFADLPNLFEQWFEFGLDFSDKPAAEESASLLDRASLFQIIAVTVDTVPGRLPFLNGETYLDVPAGFVPRIFWPGKPTALESNIRLSLYFGLVAEYSARSVSIAFGMIAEAFANFGFLGVISLGAIMGTAFKQICVAGESVDILSPLGIFVILLTAWSLQVEMVAATWFSSLFQASMVMVIFPLYGRRLLGR
jgi:hypothetical protein